MHVKQSIPTTISSKQYIEYLFRDVSDTPIAKGSIKVKDEYLNEPNTTNKR